MRTASASRHGPTIGRHRIYMVQQQGVRSQFIHLRRQFQEHRNGAERAEDTARSQGVTDTLLDAISSRNLNVVFVGFQAALLEGCDDVVGISNCLCAIGGSLNTRGQLPFVHDGLNNSLGLFQSLRIDIHEHDGAILQSRRQENVVTKIMSKDKAASPDERDFGHRR